VLYKGSKEWVTWWWCSHHHVTNVLRNMITSKGTPWKMIMLLYCSTYTTHTLCPLRGQSVCGILHKKTRLDHHHHMYRDHSVVATPSPLGIPLVSPCAKGNCSGKDSWWRAQQRELTTWQHHHHLDVPCAKGNCSAKGTGHHWVITNHHVVVED